MTEGVAARLASIRDRVAAACARSLRNPAEVTVLGAAKRQPDNRLKAACDAGLEDFGENIVQEAAAHRQLLVNAGITWHLIGPLQSNKTRKAVELFDCVHSIERLKIARRLNIEAHRVDRRMQGFLEVNLGGEPTKHGFAPEALSSALEEVAGLSHLSISGLMAIPPVSNNEGDARSWFRKLRELRDSHFGALGSLSMGMSSDFEIAIEEGATHVRIGSSLFGTRLERK